MTLPLVAPELANAGGCPDGGEQVEHEVASGQTVSGIALKYGVSQRAIERANPKLDINKIRVGQTLKICLPGKDSGGSKSSSSSKRSSSSGRSCGGGKTITNHEVEAGDTLSGIASKYDVSVDTILSRNAKLKKDPNSLRVGQELLICADNRRSKASKTCGYRTPLHTHEVLPGEHLGEIAGRYGVRRKDLIKLNSALRSNANLLRVGQKIRVCPEIAPHEMVELEVTVQSGDTLSAIAKKYGLTTNELLGYQRGKLASANDLKVGQKLIVYKQGGMLPGYGAYDDDTGDLPHGVQMPAGKYYEVKTPSRAWGTGNTVRLIQSAISSYRRGWRSSPKVHVGDISKKGGGKLPPHRSHQHGHDVDIGYVLKGDKADEVRFVNANAKNLDLARTWSLVDAFLDTDEVKYIFMDRSIQELLYDYAKKKGISQDTLDELFQYPRRRGHGIIRHSSGHVNHFHVRFRN
nr:penicillin-insensitive murein endopeptidase [Pseudenhygromyxa sp. WMMC2535]